MSLPKLIGVTGFKRSGKDTFAQVLVEEAGYTRLAFADALKEEVAGFLGIPTKELEHDKEKWREVLQRHGCAMREMDLEYWIVMIEEKIYLDDVQYVVVSDVRFQNEANWIWKNNGVIVRMVRDGIYSADPSWHVSERAVGTIKADYTLDANNIEARKQGARDLIKEWRRT